MPSLTGMPRPKRPRSRVHVPQVKIPKVELPGTEDEAFEARYAAWGRRGTRPEFIVWEYLTKTRKQIEGTDFVWQCLTGEHRVLTEELRWVPVRDLKVGQGLLSFTQTEEKYKRHRWCRGTVIANSPKPAEVYAVHLSDGTVVKATGEHPWFCSVDGLHCAYGWRQTKDLPVGVSVPRFFNVWEELTSWDAGWVAGFYDGEGCLIQTPQHAHEGRMNAIRLTQNIGPTLDRLKNCLTEAGISYAHYTYPENYRKHTPKRQPYGDIYLNHGIAGLLSFLGQFRPPRLLQKLDVNLLGSVKKCSAVEVTAVEPIGIQEVWALGVDVGTYIAEGFGMHNSSMLGGRMTFAGVVIDFWLLAFSMMWRVQGEYFHAVNVQDRTRDKLDRIRLEEMGYTVIDLWANDLITRGRYTLDLAWSGRELLKAVM